MSETTIKHREFELSPYNPEWVKIFEHAAKKLREIFGDELVRVHHVGSTSIPGMLAKPQVDMMMEVKDLDKVSNYYSEMEKAGFKPMGRKYTRSPDNEYFVKDSQDGKRLLSVHTYQIGNSEIENILVFRDYLRKNEEARNRYIQKKKELFEKYKNSYPEYRKGKFELITELKKEAWKWRRDNQR